LGLKLIARFKITETRITHSY